MKIIICGKGGKGTELTAGIPETDPICRWIENFIEVK